MFALLSPFVILLLDILDIISNLNLCFYYTHYRCNFTIFQLFFLLINCYSYIIIFYYTYYITYCIELLAL